MRPSAKKAQLRYRFKLRMLRIITNTLRLVDEPPDYVHFTEQDQAELRTKIKQQFSAWLEQEAIL